MAQQAKNQISILIVDDIPETRENLRKLLYFEPDIEIVGTAANGQEAIEQARAKQPNIVLMDINMPDMDGITASQEITRVAPMCQVIMMSVQSEADYLRRSMLAGAMDFLTKPFTSEELSSSIHRVYEMGASRRAAMPEVPMAGPGRPESPAGTETAARRRSSGGKLLVVYSPKGGTGCSTVACNLAIALHQATSKKVALVDGSLQFGDIEVMLNLQGNHTLAEVMARLDELDFELLNAMLAPHPSGIQVLAAPPSPEISETISAEDLKKTLSILLQKLDYVVLDTWSFLDDIVLAATDQADRILLVLTPEIPSIKATKQFFEIAEALNFSQQQIDLVLNKVIPRDGIRAEQLESSMQHSIMAQIDLDPRAMRQAINQGLPLVMAQPNHPVAEAFGELARHLVAQLEPEAAIVAEEPQEAPAEERPRRSGLFGRLRK
ncbi:MAG: response regulator [Anaerolineae bacterium]|jgi:pilus assembly protein CpaE